MNPRPVAVMLLCCGLLGCQAASLTAAKLYLEDGETAKAAGKLDDALAQEPDNPEVHFLLGRVAAETGRYVAMNSALEASVDLDSTYHDRVGHLRRQYWIEEYNQGVNELSAEPPDLDAAGRAFRSAIQIDPGPIGAWRNLAYVAYHQDSTQVATESAQAAGLDPSRPLRWSAESGRGPRGTRLHGRGGNRLPAGDFH